MDNTLWGVSLLALMLAASVVRASRAETTDAPGPATITVDPSRALNTIPRTVFGTFLEPIGSAIYGGLWAQVLENPSFEDGMWRAGRLARMVENDPAMRQASEMGLPLPWTPLHPQQGWRYEPRRGEAANGFASLFVMAMPHAETGVRQQVYLPVHRTLRYTGSLSVRHESGPRAVEVSLRKRDQPDAVLARATVRLEGDGWKRYTFALDLPQGAIEPLQPADFVVSMRDGTRAVIDAVHLFPADAEDGLDPDIVAMTRATRPGLIRYGGNFTSGYHWKDGIGPREKRIPMLNQSWGIPEENSFGTDEFLHFCRLVGAAPLIAVNLGSGTPEEAAGWVKYVNGHWDAKDGAPYWELGNELWGTGWQIGYPTLEELAPRTDAFSKAIRAVDPRARLIATGQDPDHDPRWNEALLTLPPDDFSLFSTHLVDGTRDVRRADPSPDFVARSAFALPVGLGRRLEEMRAQADAHPEWKGKARFAFTEWLFHGPMNGAPQDMNMGGAVIVGGMLNMLMRSAETVPVSTMTGTIEFHGLHKARGRAYGTPSYWAFQMISSADTDHRVETRTQVASYDVHEGNGRLPEIPNVPYLDVVGAVNRAGDTLTLICVNRSLDKGIPARITVPGFAGAGAARVLQASDIYQGNNEEHPEAVVPVESPLPASGSVREHTFPPASVTVLTLHRG